MPTTAAISYSEGRLDPLLSPRDAMDSMIDVQLKASQTLLAGTILGEVSATPGTYGPYSSSSLAPPTVAPTVADAANGTTTLNGTYLVAYAYRNANGSTTISPTGSVAVTSTHQINVTSLGTLPAGVTSVDWYMSDVGETTLQFVVNNAGGAFSITAVPAGGAADPPTVNTALASVDGTQNPAIILAYPATTDGSGNITNPSEWAGVTEATVPCYTKGIFKCSDLVGLDVNAVAKLRGHLIEGSPPSQSYAVASAAASGQTVTLTFAASVLPANYATLVDQYVTVSGLTASAGSVAGANGTYIVQSATATTLVYTAVGTVSGTFNSAVGTAALPAGPSTAITSGIFSF